MSIDIDHTILGAQSTVKAVKENTVGRVLEPAVRRKSATIRESYHELKFETESGLAVEFRAYDEGVAYRLETSLPKESVKVCNEEVSLKFAGDYDVFYPQEDSFLSHNERFYARHKLPDLVPAAIATKPRRSAARSASMSPWRDGTASIGMSER